MPIITNNTPRIITLGGLVSLKPGANSVPDAAWKALFTADGDKPAPCENPATKALFVKQEGEAVAQLVDTGHKVGEPDAATGELTGEELSGFTVPDATSMIASTLDVDTLKRWKKAENSSKGKQRSGVIDAIEKQIDALKLDTTEKGKKSEK